MHGFNHEGLRPFELRVLLAVLTMIVLVMIVLNVWGNLWLVITQLEAVLFMTDNVLTLAIGVVRLRNFKLVNTLMYKPR